MRLPMSERLSASGHLYSAIFPPSFLRLRRLHHCRANAYIGSAAAQIAAETVFHLFGRRVWILVEKSFAGHDKSRRAEAALLRVVVYERLLNGMKIFALHQAFNGSDLFALRLDGKHR